MQDQQRGRSSLKVCVAISSGANQTYVELGGILHDALSHAGFRSALVRDGDRAALAADVLLLLGEGSFFPDYTNLLKRKPAPRPTTALWLFEALPPPTLNERAEHKGSGVAKFISRELTSGRLLRLTWSAVPRPVRTRVREAILRLLFSNFKRAMDKDPQSLFTPDVNLCSLMMSRHVWFGQHFSAGWLDFVFTTTVSQQQSLTRMGIPARFAPLGYHPGMGINLSGERDIDVLFVGNVWGSGRRCEILSAVRQDLTLKGVEVIVQHGSYGEQRTALLNRARVSLNVAHYPWDLPSQRFLMSMACGALVISEPLDDPTPYRPGKHFVQADIADLSETICYYLEHEREREAITRTAYDFLTQELTLRNALSRIMGTCNEVGTLPAAEGRAPGVPFRDKPL